MECNHKIGNLKNYFCIIIKNMARLDFFVLKTFLRFAKIRATPCFDVS